MTTDGTATIGTVILAFVCGFVPGAGYALLGRWRLAAANILTLHWFAVGFLLAPVHCAVLANRRRGGSDA